MFSVIHTLVENGKALDINEGLFFAFNDPEVKEQIIIYNTDEQLFNGIDADGNEIRNVITGKKYSEFTKRIKRMKGQKTDVVTLKDTGEFYDTFQVAVTLKEIIIGAYTIKEGEDLQELWGDRLLGLTDENLDELLQEYIIPRLRMWILHQLLSGI